LSAILATDYEFHEEMPKLASFPPDAKDTHFAERPPL
jgi:hypothetical protein